ncbi:MULTISPECIES: iron-containing alcohol dehydrogenase [Metabacillus]|uniref:Alcohol dehydrogenase n=3 Tax=Metabacillus TaxID=2675233 RepID=A0A179SMZ2_9BACI|nr:MULTISPECIES: iron-containing alcohol dehydrogenase [Metabacillus]OAS83066.1 alcohol dehydrogenase [Metabacillus litoralis]QNF27620.1 iron-containing alcohol dehydrogenase [Metabacillus sp. KUDC1714]
MDKFAVFRTPQTILYGREAFKNVGTESALRGEKALIVSDKVMNQLGLVSQCQSYLQKEGVNSEIYLGVDSEPTDQYVAESLELLKKKKCDVVISIGGGSCIDTAKAIAVLATNDGYIGDYRANKKIVENTPIPHIAIPTTAGTGSEATDVTVITSTLNDVKMMIKQPAFMPDVAIVDPLLTITSPQHITAATGVDALSHAIEAYLSKRAHPMTDTIALSAMKLLVENILTAYNNGEDLDAREAMSLGSLQAGMAFTNASVCLVHGMSRPIGALFHVPHGYSNAMLLPAVLEFSKEACINRLADLGRIFKPNSINLTNEEAAEIAVTSVKNLCLQLNIPNLKGWGIERGAFESVVGKMAVDALDSGSPANNPRVPTQVELEELYHNCFDYQFTSEEKVM